jgi:hypothetical protein
MNKEYQPMLATLTDMVGPLGHATPTQSPVKTFMQAVERN